MSSCDYLCCQPSGLQKPGRRTRSRSTPAFTAAVWTTRATSSGRRIDQVRGGLPRRGFAPVQTSPFLTCPSLLKAKDVFLSPENDTIGILVSTAVEISVGGKTIKPAGGLGRGAGGDGHLEVGHNQ